MRGSSSIGSRQSMCDRSLARSGRGEIWLHQIRLQDAWPATRARSLTSLLAPSDTQTFKHAYRRGGKYGLAWQRGIVVAMAIEDTDKDQMAAGKREAKAHGRTTAEQAAPCALCMRDLAHTHTHTHSHEPRAKSQDGVRNADDRFLKKKKTGKNKGAADSEIQNTHSKANQCKRPHTHTHAHTRRASAALHVAELLACNCSQIIKTDRQQPSAICIFVPLFLRCNDRGSVDRTSSPVES